MNKSYTTLAEALSQLWLFRCSFEENYQIMTESKQFLLASRPTGEPTAENWQFTTEQLPELKQGEVLVKIQYISLDPAMRGWMNEGKSYIEPVKIGDVMRANAAGEVVASENEKFSKGDTVIGALGRTELCRQQW